jgi:tRNA U34 5-methylaminomethyl-2-thiouridine-forming methyltransferase MnmC
MPPPRKTFAVGHDNLIVQITDDDSRTLIDTKANVAYHSASGALAETRHVYLSNSGVADRLSSEIPTSVLEIGLGTGMGMLLTLDAALASKTSLDYTAIEYQWPNADVLRQLNLGDHMGDPSIVARFLDWRQLLGRAAPTGIYQWQGGPDQTVTIHHTDALTWEAGTTSVYDAIYFDPFAPDANPELWNPRFLSRMYGLLDDAGRLVTYCVNRQVREDFASVGFRVRRVRGPQGGKREVLIATKLVTEDYAV